MRREPSESESDLDAAAAAAALASLAAAVRQRQGELAAAGAGGADELVASLAELGRREFVQEPRPVSPRPGLGRLIVFARRAAYHLFGKWWGRAVLQQQNEFNQAAASLLAALVEREREARSELARLRRRLEALEAAGAQRNGGAGSPG